MLTDIFPQQLDPSSATAIPSGLRILVADEDRTLREGCVSLLKLVGHTVTSTGRGDEALRLVRRQRF
jgi:CheY-like chemotaxis protein